MATSPRRLEVLKYHPYGQGLITLKLKCDQQHYRTSRVKISYSWAIKVQHEFSVI